MGYEVISVKASESGKYATATITWDEGPEVTVEVSSNGSWRLSPRGDSSHPVLSDPYASSSYRDTFIAKDGGEYVLQIYCTVEETFFGNFSANGITIKFGDDEEDDGGDDGDDDGGGGGSTSDRHYIYLNKGDGVKKLEVYVDYSHGWDYGIYGKDKYEFENGERIFKGDVCSFHVEVEEGYDIYYHTLDGHQVPCQLSNFKFSKTDTGVDYYEVQYDDDAYVSAFATPKEYKLSAVAGLGSYITVSRKSSKKTDAPLGVLSNGAKIYHFDVLEISVGTEDGYDIVDATVKGCSENDDGSFTVTGDVTVTVTTERMGLVYIDNGTSFVPCLIYIDNGTNWVQYIPYIDTGTSWVICS